MKGLQLSLNHLPYNLTREKNIDQFKLINRQNNEKSNLLLCLWAVKNCYDHPANILYISEIAYPKSSIRFFTDRNKRNQAHS